MGRPDRVERRSSRSAREKLTGHTSRGPGDGPCRRSPHRAVARHPVDGLNRVPSGDESMWSLIGSSMADPSITSPHWSRYRNGGHCTQPPSRRCTIGRSRRHRHRPEIIPVVPQVAVFDTGFHSTLEAAATSTRARTNGWPKASAATDFMASITTTSPNALRKFCSAKRVGLRIVSCHLGNGCSLAAIRDGRSVDTTMGFTPLEGLMMGTRSGSVDPGILTYLATTGKTNRRAARQPAE